MYCKICLFMLAILPGIFSESAMAQAGGDSSRTSLTLEAYLQRVLRESPEAQKTINNYNKQQLTHRINRAELYPQLTLDLTGPKFTRSLVSIPRPDGTHIYTMKNQITSQADLSISQKIPWSGGQLTLLSRLERTDWLGIDSTNWLGTPVSLRLEQPLFGFNQERWTRRIDKLQQKIDQRKFRENMADIIKNMASRFFEMHEEQQQLHLQEQNVAFSDSTLRISRGRYQIGKITKIGVLESELALLNARNTLENTKLSYQQNIQKFNRNLGLPMHHEVNLIMPDTMPHFSLTLEQMLAYIRNNCSYFLEKESERLNSKKAFISAKSRAGLSASLNASYGYQKSAADLQKIYKKPEVQQSADLSLKIPLLRGKVARLESQSALVDYKNTETQIEEDEKEFIQGLEFKLQSFKLLQNSLQILAKADTIAQQKFDVAKKRYLIGKIKVAELRIAQKAKEEAHDNYIKQLQAYWLAYFEFQKTTLYDFQADRPLNFNELLENPPK